MKAEPQAEHRWLHRLVGEWTYEGEMPSPAPDKPAEKWRGTESVRSIGDLWTAAEGKGEMPGGGQATTLLTLGFDPQKKRYVGSFVGSMMTHFWSYEGSLDPAQKVLTLESDGPDFSTEGKTARYRDVIEFKSDDARTMTSYMLGEDGRWHQIMIAAYRRTK